MFNNIFNVDVLDTVVTYKQFNRTKCGQFQNMKKVNSSGFTTNNHLATGRSSGTVHYYND